MSHFVKPPAVHLTPALHIWAVLQNSLGKALKNSPCSTTQHPSTSPGASGGLYFSFSISIVAAATISPGYPQIKKLLVLKSLPLHLVTFQCPSSSELGGHSSYIRNQCSAAGIALLGSTLQILNHFKTPFSTTGIKPLLGWHLVHKKVTPISSHVSPNICQEVCQELPGLGGRSCCFSLRASPQEKHQLELGVH